MYHVALGPKGRVHNVGCWEAFLARFKIRKQDLLYFKKKRNKEQIKRNVKKICMLVLGLEKKIRKQENSLKLLVNIKAWRSEEKAKEDSNENKSKEMLQEIQEEKLMAN